MQLAFQAAGSEDADDLMVVQNAAFAHDLAKYGHCPAIVESRETMVDRIERSVFYKIVADGTAVGTIQLSVRNCFHYNITVLCVHPDFHNKGIGTQAIEFILMRHPEVRFWTLITPKDNPHSRHLYEKMGFMNSGEREEPDVTLICYELMLSGDSLNRYRDEAGREVTRDDAEIPSVAGFISGEAAALNSAVKNSAGASAKRNVHNLLFRLFQMASLLDADLDDAWDDRRRQRNKE